MIRSFFFAPANRHDLVVKFPRFDADCVVIDLEDGTPPHEKESARAKLGEAVSMLRDANLASRLLVRVNEPSSVHFLRDLEASLATDVDGVVVPKLEQPPQLFPILHIIDRLSRERPGDREKQIVGGVESILGVLNINDLVAVSPAMRAVYFGAEDFISELGGRRTLESHEVLYARSRVVLAARSRRLIALDQAVTEIRDDKIFADDAEFGRNLGYNGKICVHPRQVTLSNRLFSPSEEEVEYSRRLIAAYRAASEMGKGTIDFEGKMIDGPLLKRAEEIVTSQETLQRRKESSDGDS